MHGYLDPQMTLNEDQYSRSEEVVLIFIQQSSPQYQITYFTLLFDTREYNVGIVGYKL